MIRCSPTLACTFISLSKSRPLERTYSTCHRSLVSFLPLHYSQSPLSSVVRHLVRPRIGFHPSAAYLHVATWRPYHTTTAYQQIILRDILYTAGSMDAYKFPDYRLKKKMDDPSKTPLLLVACGSFSPITFLHLRMFVMAADYMKFNTNFELIGGYLSPVSDAYKKQGLAPAEHR